MLDIYENLKIRDVKNEDDKRHLAYNVGNSLKIEDDRMLRAYNRMICQI